MILDEINFWHQRARPNPTPENFGVQLGCHAEEFVEMLESLEPTQDVIRAMEAVEHLAEMWKQGRQKPAIRDREEFLDSLADQVVTVVGVGHCAEMNVPTAARRVNVSNWSKYDSQSQPIFTPEGKIAKGPFYHKPDLSGLY